MNVTKRIDEVIETTVELRDVRNRLAALEEERAMLEARAERILQTLANAAADSLTDNVAPMPPASGRSLRPLSLTAPYTKEPTLTDRILAFFVQHSDFEYGATEVAGALGLTSESNVNTIRGTLSRLNAEGRLERAGYGKYRQRRIEEEKKSGLPVPE